MLKMLDGDGSTIRGVVAFDQKTVFSVCDFLTHACGYKDNGATARKTFERMLQNNSEHRSKIEKLVYFVRFPGQRGPKSLAMTAEGLQLLLMISKGTFARAFKDEAFNVLQRYIDGDMSLSKEIQENKAMGKAKSRDKFMEKVMENAQMIIDKESRSIPPAKYVYGMESPKFPGEIKIGKASDLRSRRCGNNTGRANIPLSLVAFVPTFDYKRDEESAHSFFASKRGAGEFFNVTRDEVRAFFMQHIMPKYKAELVEHIAQVKASKSADIKCAELPLYQQAETDL